MSTLHVQYAVDMTKLSNSIRAALVTAFVTFIGLFSVSVLGWLTLAQEAVASGDSFPSLSILASGALSAGLAAVVGLVNFVIRATQEHLSLGNPPVYPSSFSAIKGSIGEGSKIKRTVSWK